MENPQVSIILPAYNEEHSIAEDIAVIQGAFEKAEISFEIIVVNDGSTDRTGSIVEAIPEVTLISHASNRGVGAARKTGTRAAQSEWVITSDADGTYPNHEMPRLVQMLAEHDMVVGSRTGKNVASSWFRWPAKFLIRQLASYMTRTRIPDLNSGLRAFRKSVALQYFYLLPDSHSWVSTLTLAFLSNQRSVKFVDVDYYKRKTGRSSFHPFYDTYNYIQLVIRTIMYFNPLRVFLPLSFIVFGVGAWKTIHDWFVFHDIGGADVMICVFGAMIAVAGLLADLMVVLNKKNEDPQ
ncbi:glycosyltransferase family 2 protein [Candidatus Zixiibacteriota bacterium]